MGHVLASRQEETGGKKRPPDYRIASMVLQLPRRNGRRKDARVGFALALHPLSFILAPWRCQLVRARLEMRDTP